MKTITNKTILKQADKEYQPRFVMPHGKTIYWIDFSKNVLGSDAGTYVWSVRYAKPIIFGEHENSYLKECFKIVAQSQPKLEGIPVVSLGGYVEKLKNGISEFTKLSRNEQDRYWTGKAAGFGEALQLFKSNLNPNQYTQKDIQFVINLVKHPLNYSNEQIFEQINFISVIEVNDNWEVISYE
jgi:hypothetical protein